MKMQTANQEDTMDIDLQDLLGLLLHRAWIICLAIGITGLIGFVTSFFFVTPQYESTTSVYISTNKQNEKSMTYSDAQLATQLTKDYEELIVGRYVLERVIEQFSLDDNYEGLRKRVQVTNTADTRIINITVKDPEPEKARLIADSIRDIASEHIKTVTDVEAVNVADEANLPESPSEPSVLKWTALGALIGMLLAVGVIIVGYLMDDTIKSAEDVEKYLELSTLALIPDFDVKAKQQTTLRAGLAKPGHKADDKQRLPLPAEGHRQVVTPQDKGNEKEQKQICRPSS